MSVAAVTLVVLLAVPPLGAQSPAQDLAEQGTAGSPSVVAPETLQQAFALMRQPGFHAELLELFGIEASPGSAVPVPTPAALQTWHWIWIAVGIGVAALVIFFAACPGGVCNDLAP